MTPREFRDQVARIVRAMEAPEFAPDFRLDVAIDELRDALYDYDRARDLDALAAGREVRP